jgi:hypothetical protein
MSAYRSTIHASTGYTPNFLVYGRENRAPLDLVLAVGEDEPEGVGRSPDAYVDELLQRQRWAYRFVRQHLGQAAERRKKEYDLHVRSQQFHRGEWVYYYYPRRYKGRSPKWSRMYTGPYLITRVMPPCDYVIQKSARSKPIMAHADKLKRCGGETPKSWLVEESDGQEPASVPEEQEEESPEGSDTEEVGQDQAAEENPGSAPVEPTEPRPEMNLQFDVLGDHQPVVMNDVATDAPGTDERVLRDRRRMRRPARFVD